MLQPRLLKQTMPQIVRLFKNLLLDPSGSVESQRSFPDMNYLKEARQAYAWLPAWMPLQI